METKELKTKAGIGPYQKRLQLKKVSREYKSVCPWHNDHSPSLAVFQKDREYFFKCFACADVTGDALDFIMKFDNVDFKTALAKLKEECGIADEPSEVRTQFVYDQKKATEQIDRAAGFLRSRGIDLKLARECNVGYAEYPGVGPSVGLPYNDSVVKFRALDPVDRDRKFRHLDGKPSANLLYGIDVFDSPEFLFKPEAWVLESELDSLTMRSQGFNAVSVSSATSSVADGKPKITQEHLEKLLSAEKIFLAFDQDDAGLKCAAAFEKALPSYKTFRVTWQYAGKGSGDPKDIGEIFCQTQDKFRERIEGLRAEALARPPAWRGLFKSRDQMEQGDIKFLVKDFLPEGVCMLGALSGSGKTWFALSMVKALTSGQKFLKRFDVPEPVNVIYLIPESGERSFRSRVDKMGINERFLCRTMKDGILKLDHPLLKEAIKALRPVVFLDTAIRFATGEENSSTANSTGLADAIFELLKAGAQAVIGLHHSPKSSADKFPSLENTLRGSGDIGAMCDSVYNLKCENQETLELRVTAVKARDFEPVPPFHIQGRPFINENGDFGMLLSPGLPKEQAESLSLMQAIQANPRATYRELEEKTGINVARISKRAAQMGWKKPGDTWVADQNTLV